jgi:NADH-ubiquinone oxidoreductase chain 6
MINNFLLDVLAAGAILSGILVITSKNPVIAVLFLISAFVNAAGYLLLLGVGFIGISYIIVYIGAITVLFLFVVMMINIKLVDILEVGSQYTKNLPLALTVGSLFIYEIFTIIPFSYNNVSVVNLPIDLLNYVNGLIFSSNISSISEVNVTLNPSTPDTVFSNFLQIEALGQGLYTYGAMLLILCSVILLLSMLAPITIVLSKPNQITEVEVKSHPSSGLGLTPRLSLVKNHTQLNKASYHTSSHSAKNSGHSLVSDSIENLNPWA